MSLAGFYCPDGVRVEIAECLESCRLGERCLTLPTLVKMSREREWSGTPSTTQLIDGTMLAYLKLTKPYYVDPDSRAFMIQGTKHHEELEVIAKELNLPAEIPLSVDRDIFDLLEFEGKELVMTDYKLWGSYKVAKALGIVKVGEQPDPTGAVYKRTSKWGKAGDPKMIPVFQMRADQADNWETELQQNRYRVMLGELGITIHKMRLQATVRDGGLAVARSRGVLKNIYKIPVKLLEDSYVKGYFEYKTENLKEAMANGWNSPCSSAENWDGRRCQDYCEVAEHCPKGRIELEVKRNGYL